MTRAIMVDDEVFLALQEQAVPLVDDANSVLRRLLGLADSGSAPVVADDHRVPLPPRPSGRRPAGPSSARRGRKARTTSTKKASKKSRAARGSILPESSYELPVLQALKESGGRAPATEIIDRVGEFLADQLQPSDWEELDSGLIRWKNRTQFVRLALVKTGDMTKDSPRGVWEISAQGLSRLARSAV